LPGGVEEAELLSVQQVLPGQLHPQLDILHVAVRHHTVDPHEVVVGVSGRGFEAGRVCRHEGHDEEPGNKGDYRA
jgi:hypothetical protein